MGSTGEPDRKRRHFSSISPTAGAVAKKHLLTPCSDDKKLDVAVLQFQNQKLFQQLEAQKIEYFVLEDKYHKIKKHQDIYEDTVMIANKSWEKLVGDLEPRSICTSELENPRCNLQCSHKLEDGASLAIQEDFMSRLLESGATDSCSDNESSDYQDNSTKITSVTTKNILRNITSSINCMWHMREDVASALRCNLSEDDTRIQLQKSADELNMEVRRLMIELHDLHLKHRHLTSKLQKHRDKAAKFKAEQKRLEVELAHSMSELEENNSRLAFFKSQKVGSKGAPILFPTFGNRQVADKARDKHKEIQELESSLKELKELASGRMAEINSLHEKRTVILRKLVNLKNAVLDIKNITSSSPFLSLRERLDKSKAEMDQCLPSLEKLQVEKEKILWHEQKVTMEDDIADVSRRIFHFSESRIAIFEQELQKLVHERMELEDKLEEALKEPGRKEIISEFKGLVSSFPKEMGIMQNELSRFKESSSELNCLRAQALSLSELYQRKVSELQPLYAKSSRQPSEVKRLQSVVADLRESEEELKLILEMYKRESTDSRDAMESRDRDYKAWAHVQIIKSSLDEHNLELRVKAAIEAEATSQQRLAAAEAEIEDLRQNMESCLRDLSKSSDTLKSKHEEADVYLSEIESIGQAYGDTQTQNQQLLQQITERDGYNFKLVMEGVKARQLQDVMNSEVRVMDKKILEANSLIDLYGIKATQLDEQLNVWSEQVSKLVAEGLHNSVTLGNAQERLSDIQKESLRLRESLNEVQIQAEKSRLEVTELLIELESERFNKKRMYEGLETMTMKASSLKTRTDGQVVLEKLQQEAGKYRGILKCQVCHDRQKEVVIAKCYHLFCSQCVQRTIQSRHRKCPTCSASFGPNDVKSIYI
ncbi:E3 ubiquitin-protein ligase BRE1-like 1 [Apostasia shenzhenica]|uniref:E3 ubiquitin protein ligase n=1 Tax=Apostasia shenzhenica TaxID=1088818 RepID=A0A2H9ZT32_9ASPA|nr:E3 ubiquitin-protein ligase BRE1-like 1 [Apostasia shenzhenica]